MQGRDALYQVHRQNGIRKAPPGISQKLLETLPAANNEAVLQALSQNRVGKDNAAKEFARTSLLQRTWPRLRSIATLTLLCWTIPASLLGCFVLCTLHLLRGGYLIGVGKMASGPARNKKLHDTVIVTGARMTKGLHIARHMHKAGWRVVLVDFDRWWMQGSRWSACVAAFHTVPDPEQDPVGYFQAIAGIARREKAKMYIPVSAPTTAIYDALTQEVLPTDCTCWTLTAELTGLLDDKTTFSDLCDKIGVLVPRNFRVESAQQVRDLNSDKSKLGRFKYLLKSIPYDPAHRGDLFTLPAKPAALDKYLKVIEVNQQRPWIVQQYMDGGEFSTYAIAVDGRLIAYADNEASISCLSYEHIASQEIWQWVEKFVKETKCTGQLCFDYMRNNQDGRLYCIECNPRTSTIITEFHDHQGLAPAFTRPSTVKQTIKPHRKSPPVYWFWNEIAVLLTGGDFGAFLETITRGVDAVFDPSDPLPFLGLHYMQVPVLLLRNIWTGRPWKKIDLCIGKVVELGGD